VVLLISDSLIFRKIISNQDASSFIGAHIDHTGVFGELLNTATVHAAHLTGVQKVPFNDYPLASASQFDFFQYVLSFY
jgi:hypothetical protein